MLSEKKIANLKDQMQYVKDEYHWFQMNCLVKKKVKIINKEEPIKYELDRNLCQIKHTCVRHLPLFCFVKHCSLKEGVMYKKGTKTKMKVIYYYLKTSGL